MTETLVRWRFFAAPLPSVHLSNRLHIVGLEKDRYKVVCFPVAHIDKEAKLVTTTMGGTYQLEGGRTFLTLEDLVYDIKHWLTYNSSVFFATPMSMDAAVKHLKERE